MTQPRIAEASVRAERENLRIRAERAEGAEDRAAIARADVEECLAAMLAAHRSLTTAPLAPVLRRHGRI